MKRLNKVALTALVLMTLYGCGISQTEQSPTAVSQEEEAPQTDDGATQAEATSEEEIPAAPTEGEAAVVAGSMLMPRVTDAVELSVNPADGKAVVNGPLLLFYESDMSVEDAQAEIESQYTAAGYALTEPMNFKDGGFWSTFSSPVDPATGKPAGLCVVAMAKGKDAAEVALMHTEKLLVMYNCIFR